MENRAKVGWALTAAAVVAIGAAVLLAGPALFADGPMDERMTVVAILVFVLGLAATGVAFGVPGARNAVPWVLAAPTVIVSVLMGARETGIWLVAFLLIVGSIGFSWAGALLGARLRARRSARPPP